MRLTGKRFLLLLLYAPAEGSKKNIPISGRTRLMKMCFLFREELLPDFNKDTTFEEIALPEYFAGKYGPFSKGLLNDLEFLINQQYIEAEVSRNPPIAIELAEYEYWVEHMGEFQTREYDEEVFKLTEHKGIPKAKEIWSVLSENQKKYLIEFKRALNRARLDRILEYVYKKYASKGYTDKSLIRERYLS